MTPAQRFRSKALAELESIALAEGNPLANATGYELILAKLRTDQLRLKQVQGLERKAEVKREILPDYAPYIEGVLASDAGVQDEVLTTLMVWSIDAVENETALKIAEYAIKHKLLLPDRYERTLGTLIAEEFADMGLKAFNAQQPIDTDTLLTVGDLVKDEDMPDEVRAKLHKAIGYGLRETSPESALIHLRRALELHDKAGVKKDIEHLERQLRNQAPSDEPHLQG